MEMSIIGFCLDCADAQALAAFYSKLLGWPITLTAGGWAGIHTPTGQILAFQSVEHYTPPVWPWRGGAQQQMAHIDFKVLQDDRRAAGYTYSQAKGVDE